MNDEIWINDLKRSRERIIDDFKALDKLYWKEIGKLNYSLHSAIRSYNENLEYTFNCIENTINNSRKFNNLRMFLMEELFSKMREKK